MNELAHKTNYLHEMTSSESSAMKRALLDIYRDVAKLCEKEGLTLMLSGGSCLGAIRHKGFIPWDDDLDVMMRRDDYEKLIHLMLLYIFLQKRLYLKEKSFIYLLTMIGI